MLFTRRKIAKAIPAAPLAVGMAGSVATAPPPPTAPLTYIPSGGVAEKVARDVQRAITPPGWRAFCEARDKHHDERARRQRFRHAHIENANIRALKSVSEQHKMRMQLAEFDRQNAETTTFLESLAKSLGVWDFWKGPKMLETHRENDAQPASEGGGWR